MAQQLLIGGRFGFRDVRLVKSEDNSLGIGSYGAVYRAKCDQLVCAAKVLHPILFQTRDPAAHRIVERFQREIEFLSGLRHPNVIQYLGSCADPESGLPVLFMELMDESLTSFLERPPNPPPLPLHVQLDIAHDVSQALSHLHRHEVLHRDLSSNNVLLIGTCRAKVTDFGMAKLLGSDPHLTPTYCPGTNGYMSPEALTDPPEYSEKLDVFSTDSGWRVGSRRGEGTSRSDGHSDTAVVHSSQSSACHSQVPQPWASYVHHSGQRSSCSKGTSACRGRRVGPSQGAP